jgi:pilus assembly protein CpaB
MRLLIICLVVLAVVGAGGVIILMKQFIDTRSQTQSVNAVMKGDGEETIFVLVANTTLQPGTLVDGSTYRWQKWPNGAVGENYITSAINDITAPKKISNSKVRYTITKGTPITNEMVFQADAGGILSTLLKDDMRAISVSVRPPNGPVGLILPGDKVDIILTMEVGNLLPDYKPSKAITNNNLPPVKYSSETILQDINVIAIDQDIKVTETVEKPINTVTLELSIKDAEKLSVATSMGNINLSLRSVVNSNLPINYKSITSDISISDTLRVANKNQKVESNGSKLTNTTLKPAKRRVKKKRSRTRVTIYKGGVPTIEYFPIK